VLGALTRYPAGRQPATDFERVYLAALLLAVGQVEPAETVLAGGRGRKQRKKNRGQRTDSSGREIGIWPRNWRRRCAC